MTGPLESITTVDLQLQSLELDIKALKHNREQDHKEFQEFQAMVNRNFATMQVNFDKIQANFRRLLLEPEPEDHQVDQSEQGSMQNKTQEVQTPGIPAGRPKQRLPNTPPVGAGQEKEQHLVRGSATLKDLNGKELNLDGT